VRERIEYHEAKAREQDEERAREQRYGYPAVNAGSQTFTSTTLLGLHERREPLDAVVNL
jgi:hypothetical protein